MRNHQKWRIMRIVMGAILCGLFLTLVSAAALQRALGTRLQRLVLQQSMGTVKRRIGTRLSCRGRVYRQSFTHVNTYCHVLFVLFEMTPKQHMFSKSIYSGLGC